MTHYVGGAEQRRTNELPPAMPAPANGQWSWIARSQGRRVPEEMFVPARAAGRGTRPRYPMTTRRSWALIRSPCTGWRARTRPSIRRATRPCRSASTAGRSRHPSRSRGRPRSRSPRRPRRRNRRSWDVSSTSTPRDDRTWSRSAGSGGEAPRRECRTTASGRASSNRP